MIKSTSVQMPVGKNVPLEVVDHIFKYCKFSLTGNKYRFLPNMRLYPLLFVCTEWHAFAERRLYSSVGLGDEKLGTDEDGDLIKINGKDVCDMFYRTTWSRCLSLVVDGGIGKTAGPTLIRTG